MLVIIVLIWYHVKSFIAYLPSYFCYVLSDQGTMLFIYDAMALYDD